MTSASLFFCFNSVQNNITLKLMYYFEKKSKCFNSVQNNITLKLEYHY
ncbi:hypothetical protein CATMIT_02963 [Catenibacterium mitsuokai DSM 15897]|nr:hypothetical protein CATMIT_02963 [Catenibacterium mitsuokai DSM 15897]